MAIDGHYLRRKFSELQKHPHIIASIQHIDLLSTPSFKLLPVVKVSGIEVMGLCQRRDITISLKACKDDYDIAVTFGHEVCHYIVNTLNPLEYSKGVDNDHGDRWREYMGIIGLSVDGHDSTNFIISGGVIDGLFPGLIDWR